MKHHALAIGFLIACGGGDESLLQDPASTTAQRAAVTEEARVVDEFDGVITSRKSEVVPAPFAGRLLAIHVQPGQQVRAGDQLASLDDTDLKAQLAGVIAEEKSSSSEAAALMAEASALRAQLRAQERLVALGMAPRIEATSARAALASKLAQATAAASRGGIAKAKRSILENQLAKAVLTAAFDGTVMMVQAKEGEMLVQGAAIARVFAPDSLVVRFALPNGRVRPRIGATVELRSAELDHPIVATVERMARQEAPINFTIVDASIDDPSPDLAVASIGRVRIADERGVKR